MESINYSEQQNKIINRVASISIVMVIFFMVLEIIVTAFPDGERREMEIIEWFALFQRNPLMGMRNLGLINIIATTLMIPVFYNIVRIHKNKFFAFLCFGLFLTGYSVFIANNTAFPMYELSRKVPSADSAELQYLYGAGYALLAIGVSHTPGTFLGFILIDIADVLFCVLMMLENRMRKRTPVIGLISLVLLIIFDILSSFVHSLYNFAMIVAMFGGLIALTWYIMIFIDFVHMKKNT
jgi:drug/metabolite transporter superfamily protein YnfA